jgi:hypothetical protein
LPNTQIECQGIFEAVDAVGGGLQFYGVECILYLTSYNCVAVFLAVRDN